MPKTKPKQSKPKKSAYQIEQQSKTALATNTELGLFYPQGIDKPNQEAWANLFALLRFIYSLELIDRALCREVCKSFFDLKTIEQKYKLIQNLYQMTIDKLEKARNLTKKIVVKELSQHFIQNYGDLPSFVQKIILNSVYTGKLPTQADMYKYRNDPEYQKLFPFSDRELNSKFNRQAQTPPTRYNQALTKQQVADILDRKQPPSSYM